MDIHNQAFQIPSHVSVGRIWQYPSLRVLPAYNVSALPGCRYEDAMHPTLACNQLAWHRLACDPASWLQR